MEKQVSFRLSKQELEFIAKHIDRKNINRSKLLRKLILNYVKKQQIKEGK
ncbi:ribbon-helix-helix protein, CopG family [Gottfriedia acidiceleris]